MSGVKGMKQKHAVQYPELAEAIAAMLVDDTLIWTEIPDVSSKRLLHSFMGRIFSYAIRGGISIFIRFHPKLTKVYIVRYE